MNKTLSIIHESVVDDLASLIGITHHHIIIFFIMK